MTVSAVITILVKTEIMARDNQNNRRDFLKTAAKGGLALSLTGIAANALADVVVANDFVCKNAKPFSLSI